MRLCLSHVVVAMALATGSGTALAQTQPLPAALESNGASPAPAAFYRFCEENPRECAPVRSKKFVMTDQRWEELSEVNSSVNRSIREVSDMVHYGVEDYWTLPRDGKGDCEDFALAKRAALIQKGWPSSRLLITAVLTRRGEGHAVLTVVTDRGDYILDNKRWTVMLWSETDYTFLARQSASNPRLWTALSDGPAPSTVATTRRKASFSSTGSDGGQLQ
jgi:predicted transglutaminase-like cysteine proteinase